MQLTLEQAAKAIGREDLQPHPVEAVASAGMLACMVDCTSMFWPEVGDVDTDGEVDMVTVYVDQFVMVGGDICPKCRDMPRKVTVNGATFEPITDDG